MMDFYICETEEEVVEFEVWIGYATYLPEYDETFWFWEVKDGGDYVLSPVNTPGFFYDRMDVSINSIEKQYNTGYLDVEILFDNKFIFLNSDNELSGHSLYESIDIYVNDEYYDTFLFDSNGYYDDQVYSFLWEEDSNYNNLNLKFVTHDGFMIGEDEIETISINTIGQKDYTLNFLNNETETILTPIGYKNNEIIYEEFKFKKLFPNKSVYPYEISDVISLEYIDNLNGFLPSFNYDIISKVKLDGFLYDETFVNMRWNKPYENNEYLLSVNDYMFYDEEQLKVVPGSSQEYITNNTLMIPWDYDGNYGDILFNLNINSYQEYHFYFDLQIGNEKSLRGEEGRYHFKDLSDYETWENQ